MKVITVNNLTKIYDRKAVVNNVSFEIERGSICGLLGPNGAGKTTIMKMIMDQVKCDRGYVDYDKSLKIKYLQDVPEFYEFYTIKEYLNFILDIAHYKENKEYRVTEVLKSLNLLNYDDKTIRKLSRGLRQKVGIASVIIDEPDVLILDEPVSALDPIGRKEIFDLFKIFKGRVTVIFSSHILTDIERVCDHVILINNGKIVINEDIKNLALENKVMLITFKNKEDLVLFKENFDHETTFNSEINNTLEIYDDEIEKIQKEIFSLLVKAKISVDSISIKKENLEEIFLKEVKQNG